MTTINDLLKNLAEHKGKIVSTASLSKLEIAQASACGRMYVDQNGFGFVFLPENSAKVDLRGEEIMKRLSGQDHLEMAK